MAVNNTVLGIFEHRADAEAAVVTLSDHGYTPREISVIVRDQTIGEEMKEATGVHIAEGAASGATTGGVIGGLLGLLVGLGAITIPGLGAVFIGGPLAAALGLTGAAAATVSGAATGAFAGGLVGALVGLGIPEETARYYDERVREGAILLAVPAKGGADTNKLKSLFAESNAQQIYTVA